MHLRSLACVLGFAVIVAAGHAQTVLLAGWDFQTTTNGGTAVLAAPNTPTTLLANVGTEAGTAAIYANGTHGASTWVTATSGNQITAFAGSNLNTSGTTLSTTTTSPASLALLNSSANGQSVVFVVSMTGYSNLAITYATQRTGTGFTNQDWSYSTDGTNFTSFGSSVTGIPASFVVESLSVLSSVDNAATVYIRETFTGATASAGNNRLDNVQFNASTIAVPEPSTYAAIFGAVALGGVMLQRRRQAARG